MYQILQRRHPRKIPRRCLSLNHFVLVYRNRKVMALVIQIRVLREHSASVVLHKMHHLRKFLI